MMIYNLGISLGMTVADIDMMTAGEIFDLAYYKINLTEKQKEQPAGRAATQSDYDNF